jgi:hypothetical protein
MTATHARPQSPVDPADGAWTIGGMFLDALARREFAAMAQCLAPDVRFRALLPTGPVEANAAAQTMDRFRNWFDTAEDLEVVDASIGQLGPRLYLRWRLRLTAADGGCLVIEQHVFATTAERIESLDLLCSGFHCEAT